MNRRQFLVSLVAAFAIVPSAIAQSKSPTPPSADTLVLRHGPIALFVAVALAVAVKRYRRTLD